MGRSEPTFVVPECSVHLQGDESNAVFAINYDSEESIRAASKVYKKVHKNCWNYPGFQLKAGNSTYHFLEHSGTRQLAEDIERVRRIFGDQKLSVYGISYGTVVMGVYATVFPNNVNLMVLDGSVDPNSDIISRTMDDVRSKQERLDYFIASCEFGNEQCGSTDVRSCINDLNRMVDRLGDQYESWIAPFQGILEMLGIMANKAFPSCSVPTRIWRVYATMLRMMMRLLLLIG
jgi:pimeloyl-ACP methyl ester carboxylesterase